MSRAGRRPIFNDHHDTAIQPVDRKLLNVSWGSGSSQLKETARQEGAILVDFPGVIPAHRPAYVGDGEDRIPPAVTRSCDRKERRDRGGGARARGTRCGCYTHCRGVGDLSRAGCRSIFDGHHDIAIQPVDRKLQGVARWT